MLERIMKEIRRRTRVVGSFPDRKSDLVLACTRLRYIASKAWLENRVYLDMNLLDQGCEYGDARCSPDPSAPSHSSPYG